jgi:hypothetical protein
MGKTKRLAWKLWKLENFEFSFPEMTPNHLESNLKIKSSLMEFTICNTNHQWNILPNLIHKKMTKGKEKKNPSKGYYKAIDIIHVNN